MMTAGVMILVVISCGGSGGSGDSSNDSKLIPDEDVIGGILQR
jgi:hypothetical protein